MQTVYSQDRPISSQKTSPISPNINNNIEDIIPSNAGTPQLPAVDIPPQPPVTTFDGGELVKPNPSIPDLTISTADPFSNDRTNAVQKFYQNKWKGDNKIDSSLQYIVNFDKSGTISNIKPVTQLSTDYLKPTPYPLGVGVRYITELISLCSYL